MSGLSFERVSERSDSEFRQVDEKCKFAPKDFKASIYIYEKKIVDAQSTVVLDLESVRRMSVFTVKGKTVQAKDDWLDLEP